MQGEWKLSIKVAIASTDGKVINQHFGHAEKFHIVEIGEEEYSYRETREVASCCNDGTHEMSSFEKVAETLQDCKAILVSRIGPGALAYMETKGFTIFEAPCRVDEVLKKIIDEKILEVRE